MTHEGCIYVGPAYEANGELRRDVYEADLDFGACALLEDGTIEHPVYTIRGKGEHRGGSYARKDWTFGVGTNLRVAKASIPTLIRVLADLLEEEE